MKNIKPAIENILSTDINLVITKQVVKKLDSIILQRLTDKVYIENFDNQTVIFTIAEKILRQ